MSIVLGRGQTEGLVIHAPVPPPGGQNFRSLSNDPIGFLPEASAEILRQLRELRDDRHNALRPLLEATPQFEKIAIESRIDELMRSPGENGFGLPETHPSIQVAKKQLADIQAELIRKEKRREQRSGAWKDVADTVAACEAYVKRVAADRHLAWTSADTLPGFDEVLALDDEPDAVVTKARARLAELLAEQQDIRARPIPSTIAKEIAREQVTKLAAAPSVARLISGTATEIEWPQRRDRHEVYTASPKSPGGVGFASVEGIDIFGMWLWLRGDDVIKRIEKMIDEHDDRNALSDAERARLLAANASERLKVERVECLAIRASEGRLAYRLGVDARAVLALSSELPSPEALR